MGLTMLEEQFVARLVDGDFLGEMFGLLFVEGADPSEALRRAGSPAPGTVLRDFDEMMRLIFEGDEGRPPAFAVPVEGWSMVVGGWPVADEKRVAAASRGGRAIGVMRHDYAASHSFAFAVGGELVTAFPPEAVWRRYGADPDRLAAEMAEVGLRLDDEDASHERPVEAALRLAGRIAGQLPILADFAGPLPSAQLG